MKHLVLGSEGQIGSYLCKFLESKGEEVIHFDVKRNQFEDLTMLDDAWPRLNFLTVLEDCDFVHFLAFDVGGAKYLTKYQNTHKFISNNMRMMSDIFDYLKEYKKPFIFYSSQMAYDKDSAYGQLKFLGEKITKDLNGIIVRLWNVYGCEEEGEKAHVITDFIRMAKKGEIKMMTTGEEMRQFLHVKDCSEAVWILIQNYETHKGTDFDVSSFKWTSINQIAKIVRDLIECKVISTPNSYVYRSIYKNIEPAFYKKVPGWGPEISLEEGIKQIIEETNARSIQQYIK